MKKQNVFNNPDAKEIEWDRQKRPSIDIFITNGYSDLFYENGFAYTRFFSAIKRTEWKFMRRIIKLSSKEV